MPLSNVLGVLKEAVNKVAAETSSRLSKLQLQVRRARGCHTRTTLPTAQAGVSAAGKRTVVAAVRTAPSLSGCEVQLPKASVNCDKVVGGPEHAAD
jgi:hypothetical protein